MRGTLMPLALSQVANGRTALSRCDHHTGAAFGRLRAHCTASSIVKVSALPWISSHWQNWRSRYSVGLSSKPSARR